MVDAAKSFAAVVAVSTKKRVYVPLPFDPGAAWGVKREHHVNGNVDGRSVRAVVELFDGEHGIGLGPAWRRDCHIDVGDEVRVVLRPEGPQRDGLAPDLAAALAAEPEAGAFFDSLATFYRKGYLRWIDATKRRPDVRAERIAEVVRLCKEGVKERPR